MTRKNIMSLMAVLFAACSLTATLSSCDDDEVTYGPSFTTQAQEEAKGTFTGIFTRTQVGNDNIVEAEGTCYINPTDTLNRIRVSFASGEMTELEEMQPVAANIAHADNGFKFFNKLGGSELYGTIATDDISVSFTQAVVVGRKTARFNYVFKGKKK